MYLFKTKKMENKLVDLKDLKLNDEVLVSGSDLRYFKILRAPQKRPKGTQSWNPDGYKSIKVEESFKPLNMKYGKEGRILYYDFNYKRIWLVKREEYQIF